MNRSELDAIKNPEQKERRFIELNVIEQAYHVCATDIVQRAWKKNGFSWKDRTDKWIKPSVHGWVYDVRDGLIKELPIDYSRLDDVFQYDIQT